MKSKVLYEISVCFESSDIDPRREWFDVGLRKTPLSAKRKAIRESKKPKVYEAEIIGRDAYGECVYHSYWRNGKLEIDMCV